MILVGVSRVGKTPTCLYGVALRREGHNYHLTEEDLEGACKSRSATHRSRLYGPVDRREAAPFGARGAASSITYARIEQCQHELDSRTKLFRRENIPMQTRRAYLDQRGEIASKILSPARHPEAPILVPTFDPQGTVRSGEIA